MYVNPNYSTNLFNSIFFVNFSNHGSFTIYTTMDNNANNYTVFLNSFGDLKVKFYTYYIIIIETYARGMLRCFRFN